MPQLLGKEVGPIGFGLMGFTWRANPCSQEQAFATMKAALANGMNFWNGGEFYGTPEYNSLHLLERYFEKYPEDADKVVLSIKGGVDPVTTVPDGSRESICRSMDTCIKLLKGRKKIDIFECARRDPKVPLEVTFGVLEKDYIQTGKLGAISLSEVRAETIHEAAKAVKISKIVACELELSLFSTEIFDNGVAAACAQYNIPIVAYSPLGRGLLAGQIKTLDDIPADSMLRHFPRFQPDTFDINIKLLKHVEAIAQKKGCKPSQVAINWTIAQAKKIGVPVIPIPGATTAERVDENAKVLELTNEELSEIEKILKTIEIVGARYPPFVPADT